MQLRVFAVVVTAISGLAASEPPQPFPTTSPHPHFHCTCRQRDGSHFELGQITCIRVDGKAYLARCEMFQNLTTWQKIQDGCPIARLSTASDLAH
jgi:hypothetical protein